MLHSLKQVEGSEVLLIQDDSDITCGIVLQTRVEKLTLEQWCENLTLDFTHGTNNLDFHLGGFVAYGPWNTCVRLPGIEREGRNHDYGFLMLQAEESSCMAENPDFRDRQILCGVACIGEMISRRFCTPLPISCIGILEENTEK
ncbi:Serine protease [Phytophthora megakarya]|uniref:Serine protease n=1 Tax=Phytophthora megakarya TaxID=4795 RepID=A0A225W9I4_9STRA|nr:Serine protease [Phytophthora megakarya]